MTYVMISHMTYIYLVTLHAEVICVSNTRPFPSQRVSSATLKLSCIDVGACFSRVSPTPLKSPKLVGHSLPALSLLGLPASEMAKEEFVQYFSGNRIMPGSEPAAHCYCGHQFGHFAGQLGDGCAM